MRVMYWKIFCWWIPSNCKWL